jgi:hypothetical protein
MGVGLNTMLAAVGAGGVAASKIGTSIAENAGSQKETLSKEQTPISEANDADKNEMMAAKAKLNAEKLKGLKLQARQQQLKNRGLRKKNREMRQKLKEGDK